MHNAPRKAHLVQWQGGRLWAQVEGKVAIVTGGASGIGALPLPRCSREGAKAIVTDIDDAGGRAVVGKIAGGETIYLQQDVSLDESWPGIIATAEQRFGRLDVMVANAGGAMCRSIRTRWRRPECRSARPNRPRTFANGVLFLSSDASNYMTGAELAIDGGMTGGARPH